MTTAMGESRHHPAAPTGQRRVLVTGAAGELGQAVTAELRRRGIEVTALSLGFEPGFAAESVIHGDATDTDTVSAALEGVDGVIHLAAIPHPSLGTPYEVFRTNVNATFNVLSQAATAGIAKTVIASSINAWGVPMNPHGPWPVRWPIDEDEPADVADPYSLSKQVDERTAAMIFRRWAMDVIAIRLPLTKSRHALLEFAAQVRRHPGSGAREGWSYVDRRDGSRAMVDALVGRTAPGAHSVLISAADTLLTLPSAEAVARYTPGVPLRRPVHGNQTLIDYSRATRLFGFSPRHSIHRDPIPSGASPRLEQNEVHAG